MPDRFQFPDIPQDRQSIPLYRTLMPRDPATDARRRGQAFGVRGAVRDTGARVIVSDRRASLELFRASDSLRWSTMQAMSSEEIVRGDLPDEADALRLARDFLRERKIAIANARPSGVTYTELSRVTRRQREPQTTRVALHVNYRYSLNELPVFGPGAKVQVTFGGRGRPLECYRFWRTTRREGERALISREAVLALLRRDPMFADLKPDSARVTFRRARLGYFALPPRERQGMLIPVWAFDGQVSTRELERYEFVRYVVAVDFSADEAKRLGVVLEQPTHVFA